ncbi:hypothetical protein [Kitasatospora azatica]|uniref:hypothetical protein n=1 Tax=Kitasatospora azatica TaxID=58347 RepID=UPI00056751CA|nr:hypothetical protein [Kitasatospora azatica]
MADIVLNIVLGLLTSAIGAAAGWLVQRLRRRRRLARMQEFFGMPGGSDCLLVVNRHVSSAHGHSVHRDDVSALMELAVLVNSCGARPEILAHDQTRQGLGDKAEFCLGGPASNERAAAHLGWRLPSVQFSYDPGTSSGAIQVGEQEFRQEPTAEHSPGWTYALLARLDPGNGGRPTFLIAGLTAISNHAAVRYLIGRQGELMRRHGSHGSFALILRVINPGRYGPDVVERVADVSEAAIAPAAAPVGALPAPSAPARTP